MRGENEKQCGGRSQEEQDGLDPFPAESEAALELLAVKSLPGLTGAFGDDARSWTDHHGWETRRKATAGPLVVTHHSYPAPPKQQATASSPPSRHPRRLLRVSSARTSGG